MADDQPTAWEDINPTMALARRQGRQSQSLARLQPAGPDDFRNELTACLTLVAPVGMNEEAKRDWLAVAWATLNYLPADILSDGCRVARETCDHPSKIVPTIVEATREPMEWRRNAARAAEPPQPALPRPDYIKPEEAAKILAEYGLKPTPIP